MAFSTMSSVTRQLEGNYGLKPGSPQQLSRVTSVGQQAAKLPCHGWVITEIASVGFARAQQQLQPTYSMCMTVQRTTTDIHSLGKARGPRRTVQGVGTTLSSIMK